MSSIAIGTVGIIALVIFLFARMPIGFAMGIVGFLGFWWLRDWTGAVALLDSIPYRTVANYVLSTLPLFILMGQFAFKSDIGDDLYKTMRIWLGRLPGGLAMATIGGSAGFAATSGSSIATSASMAMVALPQMRKYEYDIAMSTGCIAAGGTLGILIPPSMGFILYGVVTEESIGKLFLAGILPGILLTFLFIITILMLTLMNSKMAQPGPSTTLKEKLSSLKGAGPALILFIVVIGGIYGGIFTSTEAAAIGAFGALVIGITRKKLSLNAFFDCLLETGSVSAMIFFILIGATIFSRFLTMSNIPSSLAMYVTALDVQPSIILIAILVFYLCLGTFMDIASGLLLTLPVIYPIILDLGYDPIWFGVITVLMFEMGLVTPPVGLNVFVIKGIAQDVPIETIFRGIVPFLLAMILCVIMLIVFPQIATFLPMIM